MSREFSFNPSVKADTRSSVGGPGIEPKTTRALRQSNDGALARRGRVYARKFCTLILWLVDRHAHGPSGGLELCIERGKWHSLPERQLEIGGIIFTQVMLAAEIDSV
jgi:hypothetical protein